jgi:hypothetical protein
MNGKTAVELKSDVTISQPLALNKWRFGYIDGYCQAADGCAYAVVVTEHRELELVPVHCLLVTPQ